MLGWQHLRVAWLSDSQLEQTGPLSSWEYETGTDRGRYVEVGCKQSIFSSTLNKKESVSFLNCCLIVKLMGMSYVLQPPDVRGYA